MRKSIIIPAYNEEKGISEVIRRCKNVCKPGDEIIVVDDGSDDNTPEIAKNEGVKVLRHEKNMGKAFALIMGFKHAKNEIIVTIDADCTYPPEAIPKMVEQLKHADIVVGSRFRGMWPRSMAGYRVVANKLGALLASVILRRKVTDVTSGLRAFRKSVLKGMKIRARGLDFEAEFTARAISRGCRYREVKVRVDERKGLSKLRFFRCVLKFFVAVLRGRYF